MSKELVNIKIGNCDLQIKEHYVEEENKNYLFFYFIKESENLKHVLEISRKQLIEFKNSIDNYLYPKEDIYDSKTFNINDYPDNYASFDYSNNIKCDRCKNTSDKDSNCYYHLPTTLNFCEQCVWNIVS